ncbi:AbrB/MazE/SpoVT family DNA-binding domain-containing protein [Candidatus Gottesmanbacteria bacterium]|nr:AbrB/MazE/SpoVT family DNA-binding domain-containing protein [Candidatus Gottesmanbacteria bacterium]
MSNQIPDIQEEWLRVLKKGMVTIPKAWRLEFGFEEGEMIRAKKLSDKIVIESRGKPAPYRIYTQEELKTFLKNDRLSLSERKKFAKIKNVKERYIHPKALPSVWFL